MPLKHLQGVGVSPGVAVGPVLQVIRKRPASLPDRTDVADPEAEKARAIKILDGLADDLEARGSARKKHLKSLAKGRPDGEAAAQEQDAKELRDSGETSDLKASADPMPETPRDSVIS